MREAMLTYFHAEKQEALLFLLAGAGALVASGLLLRGDGPWRSMAWPLTAVAVIQVVVGLTVFLRTDAQVAGLAARLAGDPEAFRSEELARMARVMWSFRLYEGIELLLFAGGVALTAFFPGRQSIYAIGVGLLIQASFMLVLDLFAAQRGRVYVDAVARLAGSGGA
ncbi:MAG: hypothetical protein WCS72_15900 [Deltaproteobacteria bacterium]